MQVVSGPDYRRKVHYEAPPPGRTATEMDRYISWYGRVAGARDDLPVLTWTGIAHFYFVCIHPFEDGNGRIGRALAEKALAQRQDRPDFLAKCLVCLMNSDPSTDEKSGIYARLSTAPLKLSSRFVAPSGLIGWARTGSSSDAVHVRYGYLQLRHPTTRPPPARDHADPPLPGSGPQRKTAVVRGAGLVVELVAPNRMTAHSAILRSSGVHGGKNP